MDKLIIISDSFKGSLSSKEIATIFTKTAKKYFPDVTVVALPIADGGEGTVDAFASFEKGQLITMTVHDSYMNMIPVHYFITNNNEAVIEVASSSALTQVKGNMNPSKTSTYGVGEQIKDAISRGVKKIYLGLGGSSTNDGGCGAASALGCVFLNKDNKPFIPVGGTLKDIVSIDNSKIKELLTGVEIIALSDVKNIMHGPDGASFVYARQKGADDKMIKELDDGLIHLSEIIKKDIGTDVSKIPGSGAAGAFGAGALAFMNAKITSGIDSILDICHFDDALVGANYVFTGEGRIDSQTLKGKAIYGVCQRAKKHKVPVIVIAGCMADDLANYNYFDLGIMDIKILGTNHSVEYSMTHAKELYEQAIDFVFNDLK